MDYEVCDGSDEESKKLAEDCPAYEYGSPEYWEEFWEDRRGHSYTSSYLGDYGPSHPWDAPGMSVSDFI